MPTGLPEAGGKFLKLKLNLGCVFDSSRHVGHIGWDPKGGFDVSSIVFSFKWSKELSKWSKRLPSRHLPAQS